MAHEKYYAICENKCLVDLTQTWELIVYKNWSDGATRKFQNLKCTGMKEAFNIAVKPKIVSSTSVEDEAKIKEAFDKISYISPQEDEIVVYCPLDDAPDLQFSIIITLM